MARVPTTRQQLPASLALPVAAVAILRRPLRDAGVILFVTVVLLSSLILSSIPRFTNRISDDGLRQAVEDALVQQAGISVIIEDRLGRSATGDSFADLAQRGEGYHQQLAPALRRAIDDGNYLVETPRFLSIDATGQPLGASIRIRYDSNIWEHVSLTSGREPAPREPLAPSEALGFTMPDDTPLPVFEIALTTATAEQLGVGLNDRLLLEPSASSSLTAGSFGSQSQPVRVIMEVVGLIAIDRPDDPVWFGDTRLHRPDVSLQGDITHVEASAIAAWDEAVYTDLYRNTLISTRQAFPWTYSWRFPVNPPGIEANTLDALQRDLRNLETTRGPLPALFNDPDEARIVTGLPEVIESVREQQHLFATTIVLAGVGLLALTLSLLSLVATLLIQRRRASILLLRGRGASKRQLVTAQLIEGILLSLPAACLGVLLGQALFGGPAGSVSLLAAAVVAVGATLLLVAAILPITRPPLGALQRGPVRARRTDAQRLVTEATVIALAIAGVVLLRRRGLESSIASDDRFAVDPYLAAVPVLLSVAVGLVTVRVAPYPLRTIAAVAMRRPDLVPFVALRRTSQQPVGGSLPSIAMLVAVAISVFMLIMASTIEQAREVDAWQTTGADYRIDLEPVIDTTQVIQALTAVDGVETVAQATLISDALPSADGSALEQISLNVIDADTHQTVVAGTPADPHFPPAFLDTNAAPGTDRSSAIPALASAGWLSRQGLGIGDALVIEAGNTQLQIVVIEERARFPGIAPGEPFLLVPSDWLTDANLAPTTLFVRGRDGLTSQIAEAMTTAAEGSSEATIISRTAVQAERGDAPFARGITNSFRLTVVLAAACAALGALVVQALAAQARARDLGFLRTLGLSTRQAFALAIAEQISLTAIASIVGALLGIGIARLVEPGLPLAVFAGLPADQAAPLNVGWLATAALTTAVVLFVLGAICLFTLLARRSQIGRIMRAGD